MIFDFEKDFANSLRCIPMIARQKLDIVGIKLSLRQWSRLSHDERATLTDQPCDTQAGQDAYRASVLDLIRTRTDEPPRYLDSSGIDDWAGPDRMPDAVLVQARRDGVAAPTAGEWAALAPLRRFALVKLARSAHENRNFVPAMKEFGLLRQDASVIPEPAGSP